MSGEGDVLSVVEFPAEWIEPGWLPGFPELVLACQHDRMSGDVFVTGGVLNDRANVVAVSWSSGFHVARCGPPLWAVEERVDPDAPAAVRDVWRMVIESMIHARSEAERKFGGMP